METRVPLVTGAAGFLGKRVVDQLLDRGPVRALVRDATRAGELLSLARGRPLELEEGNLLSERDLDRALLGVDVVYHLAASLKGQPPDMFLNTVVATKGLLERALVAGATRVVLVSSFAVYGVAALPTGSLIDEGVPLEPHPELRDPYSYCKRRQEELAMIFAKVSGLPLVVLRPGVIYGPGGGLMHPRVGLEMFGLFLFLGRSNLLPLTYVDNCASAVALAGVVPGVEGGAYNVVDDELITAREYLRRYQSAVRPLRVVPVPYLALEAMSWAVMEVSRRSQGQLPAVFTPYKTATMWRGMRYSNQRAKEALGWRPQVGLEEGLALAWASSRCRGRPFPDVRPSSRD